MSVLICYSAGDVDIALAIRNILASRGIGVRMDPRNVLLGKDREASGSAAIAGCSHIVLLLSEYSNGCAEVETHWLRGLDLGKVIVPVRIGNVTLPPRLRADQAIPYSQLGLEGTVQTLLRLLPHSSRREPAPQAMGSASALRQLRQRNRSLLRSDLHQRDAALRAAALHLARQRLRLRAVACSGMVYAVGFALAGSLGGLVGAALARAAGIWATGPFGLGMVVALGSAAVGAGSCALAGALGLVLAGEIVGEAVKGKSGGTSAFGVVIEMVIEGLGGALWGAACGLMVGVAAGVCAGSLGLAIGGVGGLMVAGAVGGASVGAALGVIVRLLAETGSRARASGTKGG